MQKYFNNVTNRTGDVVPGAIVTVTLAATGALATIYSDDGVTTRANPITADNSGYFSFYVADGRYTFTINGNGIQTLTIADVAIEDSASEAAAAAASAAAAAASAADAQASATSLFGAAGVSWDVASFPLYVAHRGMEMAFPENTLVAFEEAVKAGAGAVEMDCYVMADGKLAVLHDSTTARTCRFPDGSAISLNVESLRAQDLYGLDASYKPTASSLGFNGSDFINNPPPLLQDVLATLKGKTIMMIEAKGSNSAKGQECAQAIADLVDKLRLQASVVIQSSQNLTDVGVDLKGAKWGIIKTTTQLSEVELDALVADGCYMIIMDKAGIDSTYKALVNSKGMKLAGYTYSRPDEVTTVPDVVLSADTTIVAGQRLAGTRDYLMRQYPGPGYTREGFGGSPGTSLVYPVIRTISSRKAIGWEAAAASTGQISRMVICCVDPDPDNDGQYTLDFDVIWTAFEAAMTSFCFISVELDKAGTLAENAASSITKRGYSIGFRANGNAAMYRLSGDTPTATSIASAAGLPNPPALNTPYPCRIVVSSTQVIATFDVGGLNVTMTANDTTHRGGKYIQVERRGHGFMIANLRAS